MAWWNTLFGGNVNRTAGSQPVNIGNFQPAPTGFQWGGGLATPGRQSFTNIGGARNLLTGGFGARGAPGVLGYDRDPEEEDMSPKKGIERLLTGGRGQAIAGIAGAVSNVIGSAMERKAQSERAKLEREQFELMKKQEEERRRRDEEIRKLLMAEYSKFTPRG
jgi:hypothetical protein